MVEAYTVSFDKANYHAPIPDGYDQDMIYQAREHEIQDNLLRYIGEYRLGVKFDEYFYREEQDSITGEKYLASKEPGAVRDIYKNAIAYKESQGVSVKREVAECLGFEKLESKLLNGPEGAMAVWVSPPGTQDEGYGTYSFTFIAQAQDTENGRQIRMIPYRNEMSLEEHNQYLTQLSGRFVSYATDTQYLANPLFLSPETGLLTPEDVIKCIGETEEFENDWYDEFRRDAWPLIQGYLYLVRTGASDDELVKAKYALENFAIAYRNDKEETVLKIAEPSEGRSLIDVWGEERPEIILGSCGGTGELSESGGSFLGMPLLPMQFREAFGMQDKWGSLEFDCPHCTFKNRRPYGKLIESCGEGQKGGCGQNVRC